MTTTLMSSTLPLGRAPMPVDAGVLAFVTNHAHAPATAVTAHAATAATWLSGSGFAGHMGFGSTAVACESTVTTNSIKRIHPGRLEGMT